jgi:hypothetical protein
MDSCVKKTALAIRCCFRLIFWVKSSLRFYCDVGAVFVILTRILPTAVVRRWGRAHNQ